MNGWKHFLGEISKRLWFRSSLYGLFSILFVLLSYYAAPLFPDWFSTLIGADSVKSILTIIASSMLAVTTFSLAIMVSSYSTAANSASPRASKILIEDPTSQNSLSMFIGAFIFSLVGLIAVETGYYQTSEKAVIFLVTIVMIILILITFFKWIDYLSSLGRVVNIIDKVEESAISSVKTHCKDPFSGANQLVQIPTDSFVFKSKSIGYLQYIEIETLSEIAKKAKGEIYLSVNPGGFVTGTAPLAFTTWEVSDEESKKIDEAFIVSNERSFEKDPRFGLIVLSEIASRALSPSVNDPGTAINIIGRMVRVLTVWGESEENKYEVLYSNIFVSPIKVADFFDDSFLAISRDAAGLVEVGIRLQKGLIHLSKLGIEPFKICAKQYSDIAISQSKFALNLERDVEKLIDLGDQIRLK